MEKITSENYDKEYPLIINSELLEEKGFGSGVPNEEYFRLVNLYKSFLDRYIKEKLPLELIDTNMKKSELKFVPIKEEDMDYYQITSTMGLSYIYLRNNIYIEKLSLDDIKYLSSKDKYDDEVREFIKRTYLSVINPYSDDENLIIFYGPENSKHLCESKDIVIGIRYNEFDENGMSDEEYQENFIAQLRLVAQLSTVLEIGGENELGSKVRCIQYNELSIMKKYRSSTK